MEEFELRSKGGGSLHCYCWKPETEPRGVVQLVHGIAEYAGRYSDFAAYLTGKGYIVYAEDHMGHGGSVCDKTPLGCVCGGWKAMVEDVHTLFEYARADDPDVPCFLFGHSMGSFLARSFLIDYPEAPLRGAVISGTAWQPEAALTTARLLCRTEVLRRGAEGISPLIYQLAFGAYNKAFRPVRTKNDWLSRDEEQVDRYNSDPLCGFVPSVGLLGSMMDGLSHIQKTGNLEKMNKDLPVFFLSGDQDPVGNQGVGVTRSVQAFRKAGMEDVTLRLWPGGRHEMLNEINRQTVYESVSGWLDQHL